ncbi:DUF1674 domain-containing protein [Methylocella tundrae]|uniref:DUF1674 domain-containing protein n=1 Tax=Methylocella tundrae TaxID=227605 RepID=A0A4U8Z177_METTU|nr:succinate dehydrogenase assembly factor 4 [Methylocella tundrae]WPP03102.1 DUF1674 domain-containing protein [Methylocella tundrae]VFU09058.1 protein of unknown function [Methylocella tundrae]
MSTEEKTDGGAAASAIDLPAAARRALAEAEERRRAKARESAERPREINGRDGPEPVRYGDWEVKGIASDF